MTVHQVASTLVAVGLFGSSCATSFIPVGVLLEKAKRNEVAAAHATANRSVLVSGTVVDIAFMGNTMLVSDGTSERAGPVAVSRSTTRRQTVQVPYVTLRTAEGNLVVCFLARAGLNDADRLEKEMTAQFSGDFNSFGRDSSGALQVNLRSCRVED